MPEPLTILEYFVCGDQSPKAQTIVMLAGWPDTAEVFRPNFIKKFGDRYRIVAVTLPGYTQSSRKKHGLPAGGWTFDQVTSAFCNTLDEAVNPSTCYRKPILICHDWGSVIANEFLIRRPRFFEKVVMLDVSGQAAGDTPGWTVARLLTGKINSCPLPKMLLILCYQSWILIAYFLSLVGLTGLGQMMVTYFAKSWKFPIYNREPVLKDDCSYGGATPQMGHLYAQLWWHVFLRRPLAHMQDYRDPVVPVFYGYGTNKPMQFHTKSWLRMLSSRTPKDGSMAVPYDGDHWFWFDTESAVGGQVMRDVEYFLTARK